MMCGVENPLQRVMPATISTSSNSNGPLHSGAERDDIGIPGNDRLELSCTSSSSPSKHQDFDKTVESGSLSDASQRRRNSDNNLPPSTPGGSIPPPRPVSSINDDLGSTDEVKVFKDEDDRDGNASESHQAELLAEKSSLITESEQERGSSSPHPGGDKEHGLCGLVDGIGGVSAGDLSLAGKFFDTSFGMGYLMSPYAAAYANGLTNGSHMVRSSGSPLSPFLYAATAGASGSGAHGDPMSSPPPAHMGTYLDKSSLGLRPPIYPLPTSQYPYAMLGADQLAAWHQQAAFCYHQAEASLRSASSSPYACTLPITSPSLTSPMSHFSSTSGLLSHPGLSSSGHLPHLKQEFPGKDSGAHLKSKYMKKKEPHIKKPLNAFMIYMKDMRPVVQAECTLKESAAINQLLGRRWHGLTREEQAKYYEKARVERQKHMQMYPHWNARDNYRFGTKKKKRTKREKAIEASKDNSMKKCRARFGLEQHNLWCKPCRRKKKCIRLLIQNQGNHRSNGYNLNASESTSSSSKGLSSNNDSLGHQQTSSYSSQPQRMLDPNPSINELRRLIPTIGMEKSSRHDSSFNKILHSPSDSTSQSTGFETNSETSVRSPSGLSSLPSIGSPSSITSPQTCTATSYFDSTIPISMLSNGNSGSHQHDWFRANSSSGIEFPSAFKPLSSTTSSSSATPSYRVTSSPKGFSTSFSDSTSSNYLFSSSGNNIFNPTSLNSIMNMNSTSASVINSQSNRVRVGADPRDAKNPLSISQLTGNSSVNNELDDEERNSGKDFMSYNAKVPLNGLTDDRETNSRGDNSRRDSVTDKLHRTFTAERISSLIV